MEINIEVKERTVQGSSENKRLRREEDLVPAVVYGGNKEPKMISITDKVLRKASEEESFFSQIINLKLNGSSERVVLKELQRHPYRPFFIHVDFLRIREDVKLSMHIPIHYINSETCVGVKQQGGVLSYDLTELDVSCLPKDLPAFIEVDLAELELNQILHISEVQLPEGVEALALVQDKEGDHDLPVVRVIEPRIAEEEEEELEAAEGEEDEEAAADEESKEETEGDSKDE